MIFVSYSHRDSKWSEDLLTMAAPLQRYGGISVWSDADIAAGSKWRATIGNSLDKAAVAVLLVSRHFLKSKFIMEIELPYILKARQKRGLRVLWVMLSHCLYEETPLQELQAALPTDPPLDALSESKKNQALKVLCQKMKQSWLDYERPKINANLGGKKVHPKENVQVLSSPATRRVEVFVRPDNSPDWYHQGSIPDGHVSRMCHFGNEKTKPGTGYHMVAITTDAPVTGQGGKPMQSLPKLRTRSAPVRVVRV